MDANPDPTLLVAEHIDVMISRAHGAELHARFFTQRTLDRGSECLPGFILEDRIVVGRIA